MAVNQVIWKAVGCSEDTGIHHGYHCQKENRVIYERPRRYPSSTERKRFTRISPGWENSSGNWGSSLFSLWALCNVTPLTISALSNLRVSMEWAGRHLETWSDLCGEILFSVQHEMHNNQAYSAMINNKSSLFCTSAMKACWTLLAFIHTVLFVVQLLSSLSIRAMISH